MTLTGAHSKLLAMNQAVFTTGDASIQLDISRGYASKVLARLTEAGHLVSLAHGLWGFSEKIQALALPQHLTDPFPSYVSLQSALYYHGLISQIPSVTYAVSLARTRRFDTPLGAVSIHHVDSSFFFGFDSVGDQGTKMAVPEKALLDVFYLSPAKTRLFRVLPELAIPGNFSVAKARRMIGRIQSAQRKTLVNNLLEEMLSRSRMEA